ncbi:uncharacterized protein [Rutidosis leptorrhynchoides]|uniref:uncharacterized protein n=1 Tax=Rutidosis leptorrhynchoides TaxID=125765 RepID=UPI003A9A055B
MSEDNSHTRNSEISELTSQLAKLIQANVESQAHRLPDSLKINLSLNNTNFSLWSRMMKVAIGGKSDALLKHLTDDPPEVTSNKWNQEDLVVFSWIIQKIEPQIASNLTQFPITKTLWNALVTTYSVGKDKLQTFDLHVRANNIKQEGKPLEELWLKMQGIWGEIEMRDPNPMEHPSDIVKYNNLRSEQKLFQFLNALDQKHDNIKREILRLDPLPTVESAYAAIHKETAHQTIFGTKTEAPTHSGIATGLVASKTKEHDGHGLISKKQSRSDYSQLSRDKDKLECGKCGMKRHTKEQCFKVIGYPEWWNDGHTKGKASMVTVAVATGGNLEANNSGASATGSFGLLAAEQLGGGNLGCLSDQKMGVSVSYTNVVSNKTKNNEWIIDSGATDTMTFDETDIYLQSKPNKYKIKTDIRTGEIIGRGTERDGLYYVDEVTHDGTTMLAHGTINRQAWLWHRRLGHPSAGYLSILFPSLFSHNKTFECETCILAKSHQNSFKPSNTKTERPFSLVHSDVWGPARGEIEPNHTVSWLDIPSSEKVTHATEPQSTPSFSTNDLPHEEVSTESLETNTTNRENEDVSVQESATESEEHVEQPTEQTQQQYNLPPIVNRGIPPKRFSPEREPRRSRYPMADIAKGNLSTEAKQFTSALYSEEIPTSVEQALKSTNWRKAMEEEIKALQTNNTWEKCTLPESKKPVGCRWVFTIKHKSDGTIERYKARLVAKWYTQTYGVNYSETFSPVAKIDTIRVLFSVAANKDLPLHQFDVKNAFLHGELKEEVYMEGPPGFSSNFKAREVCRLKKSLYRLKQSPRAWFGRFTLAMKNYGFKQSNSDHTLFLKQRNNLITCLIIYVENMIITGNDQEEIANLKLNLFKEFEMKDLGRLKYFLEIKVLRSQQGIFICQNKYILAETGLVDCKPAESPMIPNKRLYIEEKGNPADQSQYQRIVEKLIYLTHTRPDIAHVVGVVSQFMHQPQKHHMDAVWRIIKYLKGTVGDGVLFKRNHHLETQIFTDAGYRGEKGDRKSTAGYFALVGGNLVTWRSKKQKVVALSSAEAEYRGIDRGVTEALWIKKLLTEIGFPPQNPIKIMCDNEAAIAILENPVQHDRTKHIEIDRYFIKEKLEAEIISLPFVRSEDQLADILTKSVNGISFHELLVKLNNGNPTIQRAGEC